MIVFLGLHNFASWTAHSASWTGQNLQNWLDCMVRICPATWNFRGFENCTACFHFTSEPNTQWCVWSWKSCKFRWHNANSSAAQICF